jgi:hypothetical protein
VNPGNPSYSDATTMSIPMPTLPGFRTMPWITKIACTMQIGTVPQRIHWFSFFCPCEPSFTICSMEGITFARMLKMMELEMYGMIPRLKMPNESTSPAESTETRFKSPPSPPPSPFDSMSRCTSRMRASGIPGIGIW